MKNNIVLFYKRKGTPEKQRLVTTLPVFKNYLEQLFYFTSPVENFAQQKSIAYAKSIYEKLKETPLLSEEDEKIIKKQELQLKKINGKIRSIQKYYKCPYYSALDMELVSKYNEDTYGKNTSKYICVDKVNLRNQKRKYIWETKMGYNGTYTPYEK